MATLSNQRVTHVETSIPFNSADVKAQRLGSHCCCWPGLIAWCVPGNARFPNPPDWAPPWQWAQWCWQSKSNFLGNPWLLLLLPANMDNNIVVSCRCGFYCQKWTGHLCVHFPMTMWIKSGDARANQGQPFPLKKTGRMPKTIQKDSWLQKTAKFASKIAIYMSIGCFWTLPIKYLWLFWRTLLGGWNHWGYSRPSVNQTWLAEQTANSTEVLMGKTSDYSK